MSNVLMHSCTGHLLPVLVPANAPPTLKTTPTLTLDSTTQMTYDYNFESEYHGSELNSALSHDHQNQNQNQQLSTHSSYSSNNVFGYNFFFGPFHPDFLKQFNDGFPFTDDSPEIDEEAEEEEEEMTKMGCHLNKRCRMSNESNSEPPLSAVSYSSFNDGYSSVSSATSHSQRSLSMEFPFSNHHHSHNHHNHHHHDGSFYIADHVVYCHCSYKCVQFL